jgi:predicted transcriptional regulator
MILHVARKANLTVRQYIADRFELGDTQLQIAKDLGISPASVRYYLRLAGVPSAVYGKKIETAEGKRICSRCGKPKTPGAFTSKRSTVCRMCYKV